MGNLQKPENFNMKDLVLDVSLKTCVGGSPYDFTGRKTFDTTFYRKNIGFGITDISIEINTSLQPIIDITFKDLYGNTAFGGQRGDNNAIDTSVLFDWPPPKFIFSFKGYLGRNVTWMLNLKTTNVTYVPSDGSYEIKCSFVPNQWGFLADIPVLYLLACKKLRYAAYGNKETTPTGDSNCVFKTDSVFSLTRVGKKVDTKTTEETKEFDLLTQQLAAIKYGLASAICSTKIIKLNDLIIGVVDNIGIQGFTNLKVMDGGKSQEELEALFKNGNNLDQLNTFLQLNMCQGADGDPSSQTPKKIISENIDLDTIKGLYSGSDGLTELGESRSKIFSIIDKNLSLINNEIKRRIFQSSKTELSKLTIGEVFRQLARDSGFILGSILQAGFEGYQNYKAQRDSRTDLIGSCFPLIIDDKQVEVPATDGYGVGVEEYEMKFVEDFIAAIGEGIAENLVSDEISAASTDKIQNRINNLEAIQPNPYKPYYTNIAENILLRSGIIAFITRSSDPNVPGDYSATFGLDRDGANSIKTLAESDMQNLTKDIIGQLSYEDVASVKRFCQFFDRLLSDDGESILNVSGEPDGTLSALFNHYNVGIDKKILNHDVAIGEITEDYKTAVKKNDKVAIAAAIQKSNISTLSLDRLINEIALGKKSPNSINTTAISGMTINSVGNLVPTTDSPLTAIEEENNPDANVRAFYNMSEIDLNTLTATKVKNNGLYWTIPNAENDKYYFVLFDNPSDASNTKKINVSDATKPEDIENRSFWHGKEENPIGYVPIDTWENTYNKGTELSSIKIINDRIEINRCLNYSKCKNYYGNYSDYLQLSSSTVQKDGNKLPNEVEAKDLTYSIYTHTQAASPTEGNTSANLVFGPFSKNKHSNGDNRSRNQRIAIKVMCNSILKKFDEIETEKNEIIATVLGKANENKNSLYKQMHTIFHQWQGVAASNPKEPCQPYSLQDGESLALSMEKEFGLCANHQNRDGNTPLKKYPINGNTLFVYDYPLAPVNQGNKIDVKNSVINIEALYKPNGSTTVLNIITQICTKNNFIFVPFPGDANSDNISNIYKPCPTSNNSEIKNYFHVLFAPTPETRTKLKNGANEYLADKMDVNTNFQNSAISINFGSVNNQIIKGVNVGTDSTKPTAESILNLQRLVDKENTNKKVGIDCSMLPVYEGRSYRATIDMIGNAQVYPMQYFYIQSMPMFGGLYQIMKVSHNITPNNMITKAEGIRMRFSTNGSYGGIPPVTLDDLKSLKGFSQPLVMQQNTNPIGTVSETVILNVGGAGITTDSAGLINVTLFDSPKTFQVTSGYYRSGKWDPPHAVHGATDIGLPSGTPVLSPFSGTVGHAGYDKYNGGMVQLSFTSDVATMMTTIQGAEFNVQFDHLREWFVKTGDPVAQGQVIGISGGNATDPNHGSSEKPHLHFELIINEFLIDPLRYLKIKNLTIPNTIKIAPESTLWQHKIGKVYHLPTTTPQFPIGSA